MSRFIPILLVGTALSACATTYDSAPVAQVQTEEEVVEQLADDPAGQADVPPIDYVREAGSEGIELVMWLVARGAMADLGGGTPPTVRHRFYHVPASNTAVGHLILEN